MPKRLYRSFQALLLLGMCIFLGFKAVNGQLTFYINQRFVPLTIFGIIFLAVLAQTMFSEIKRSRQHDDEHEHDHAPVSSNLWFMLVPLLIGVLIPARPLDSSALATKGFNTSAPLVSADSSAQIFETASEERNVLDWLKLFNYERDVSQFFGQKASVIGFVYFNEALGENQFLVSRFVVSCCAADAFALGIVVDWGQTATLKQDSWVLVKGDVQSITLNGQVVPLIKAESVQAVPVPEQPYLFSMKIRLTFDTAAIGVLIILSVALGLTILLGAQAGVRVSATVPERIAPFQKIKLTFSESVDTKMAESLFSIQPAMDGRLDWLDSRTLTFSPSHPFDLDTDYKLILSPGILTEDGAALKNEQSWQMKVRDPLVAYLLTGEGQSGVWGMDLNGNPAQRLTPEEIKVMSFDTSSDGEFVIFTAANKQKGIDLWRVSRGGGDASVLMDCGLDRCTMPTISPNGARIVYSREAAGPGPDLPFGSPRTWVLDLQSGQNSAVYADQQIIGYGPAWSDSQKVTSYDGLADQIRMFDLKTNQQYVFPSNTGGPVTWSADSTKLMFTDIQQGENGLHTRVRLADLSLSDTTTLLGENDEHDYSYYSLAWSPTKNLVVLGFRMSEDQPAQVFWLFDPGILEGIIIADQEGYTHNSPNWDPWGEALVFQQFKLKGKLKPEIGVWKSGFTEPLILTNGLMPQWLP